MISSKLTVLFDNPFWIGVFEVVEGKEYKVLKVTFGPEPKDYEVYQFLLRNYNKLKFKSSDIINDQVLKKKKENPKRLQREIRKDLQKESIGTKAQIAIKKQHEANKTEQKKLSKKEKELQEKRLFEMKQNKRKEKHKGH